MTQPLVAARKPPALQAFFANEMCTDFFRHLVQFGGVRASSRPVGMERHLTEANYTKRMSPNRRALVSHLTNGPLHPMIEKMVHKNADRIFDSFMASTPVEWARRVYAHWLFDEKARDESTIPEGSSPVSATSTSRSRWCRTSGLQPAPVRKLRLFENAATPADRKWMILGPPGSTCRCTPGRVKRSHSSTTSCATSTTATASSRRCATGSRADRFVSSTAFPPPDGEIKRLYLGSGGHDHANHRLDAQRTAAGSNSWVAVPFGVPVLGGLDEIANQTLTFDLPSPRPSTSPGRSPPE